MLPSKHTWLTIKPSLQQILKGGFQIVPILSFLGKKVSNGRQHKINIKVLRKRLLTEAFDVLKLASNSQNRRANTLVRH